MEGKSLMKGQTGPICDSARVGIDKQPKKKSRSDEGIDWKPASGGGDRFVELE